MEGVVARPSRSHRRWPPTKVSASTSPALAFGSTRAPDALDDSSIIHKLDRVRRDALSNELLREKITHGSVRIVPDAA